MPKPTPSSNLRNILNLRRKVRAELKRTGDQFEKHIKKNNCKTDSGGCTDRAKFQEREAALNWVIQLLGGRPEPITENTTIDELGRYYLNGDI